MSLPSFMWLALDWRENLDLDCVSCCLCYRTIDPALNLFIT